jgi:hypothetical protein
VSNISLRYRGSSCTVLPLSCMVISTVSEAALPPLFCDFGFLSADSLHPGRSVGRRDMSGSSRQLRVRRRHGHAPLDRCGRSPKDGVSVQLLDLGDVRDRSTP